MNTKTTGLPDLDTATSNSESPGEVRNSTKTKLAVIIFLLVMLAGAGVAMKSLLFTPKAVTVSDAASTRDVEPAGSMPVNTLATAPAAAQQPMTVGNPLDAQPDDRRAVDTRLDRVEDRLASLAAAQTGLGQDMAASSDAIQARLTGIESTITALTSRIDALRQADDSDAMARFAAQLKQFDQRMVRVEKRTRDNWKQLHGKAGARRRGASLPFHVAAIDWWDGKPSVAIRTGTGEQFLSVGDALAGWRLVSVDAVTGQAHFSRNGLDATVDVGAAR